MKSWMLGTLTTSLNFQNVSDITCLRFHSRSWDLQWYSIQLSVDLNLFSTVNSFSFCSSLIMTGFAFISTFYKSFFISFQSFYLDFFSSFGSLWFQSFLGFLHFYKRKEMLKKKSPIEKRINGWAQDIEIREAVRMQNSFLMALQSQDQFLFCELMLVPEINGMLEFIF